MHGVFGQTELDIIDELESLRDELGRDIGLLLRRHSAAHLGDDSGQCRPGRGRQRINVFVLGSLGLTRHAVGRGWAGRQVPLDKARCRTVLGLLAEIEEAPNRQCDQHNDADQNILHGKALSQSFNYGYKISGIRLNVKVLRPSRVRLPPDRRPLAVFATLNRNETMLAEDRLPNHPSLTLAARILFTSLFFLSGVTHFTNIPYYVSLMPEAVPVPVFWTLLSGVVELAGAAMILFNWRPRLGGWLLVLFLLPVTVVVHGYELVTQDDPVIGALQQAHFLKGFSLMGGALLITQLGVSHRPAPVPAGQVSPAVQS